MKKLEPAPVLVPQNLRMTWQVLLVVLVHLFSSLATEKGTARQSFSSPGATTQAYQVVQTRHRRRLWIQWISDPPARGGVVVPVSP